MDLGWSNWSDKRLKKDIMNLSAENNTAKIFQLDGVRFRWKDIDTRLYLGFIAQDVKDIIPECVIYDELNDIYSIEYTMIIPVLVEAFKEQQKQIQDQQKDIDELKALVNNLVLNK